MSIWGWLKLTIAVWLFRQALKLAGWPVTVVAVAGYGAAWLRGWPPARLWRAAGWSMPMTAVYLTGQALRLRSWPAVILAPVSDWADAWRLLAAHAILRAGLLTAPVAVPAGLAIGGLWWRGGSTRLPPGWPGAPPPRRSGSMIASGGTRSAVPVAGPPPPVLSRC